VRDGERAAEAQVNRAQEAAPGDYPSAVRDGVYAMNNDTGEIVLNSHVSHICALSEGGPRWDPEMSEEENRSESNLIPM
jgi:hypothetical protein